MNKIKEYYTTVKNYVQKHRDICGTVTAIFVSLVLFAPTNIVGWIGAIIVGVVAYVGICLAISAWRNRTFWK